MAAGFTAWVAIGYAQGAALDLGMRTLVSLGTPAGLALLATGLARLPHEDTRGSAGVGALLAGMLQGASTAREWGQEGWVEDGLLALGLLLVGWALFFVAGPAAYRVAAAGCATAALGVALWIPINVTAGAWVWMPGTALLVAGALAAGWALWTAPAQAHGATAPAAPA